MPRDPIGVAVVPPASPRRCGDCMALQAGLPQFGQGREARCADAADRIISWNWLSGDAAPSWCPREKAQP